MNIRIVAHSEISQRDIDTAIVLKEQYWKYGVESQLKWMNENLAPNDLHCFLLTESGEAAAYMNIVNVKGEFDGNENDFWGLGNVCIKKKYAGQGYVQYMIKTFFSDYNLPRKPGLLLCHKNLIAFYEKARWTLLEYRNALVSNRPYSLCIMTYGYQQHTNFEYIRINRSF